jgi:hypothetical protein
MSAAFARDSITIAMSPGGRVLWFGVARDWVANMRSVISLRAGESEDLDRDGRVVLQRADLVSRSRLEGERELERGPETVETAPHQAIWTFLDLTSRSGVVAANPRFGLAPLEVDLDSFTPRADTFEARGSVLDVLLYRPGVGLWENRVQDGGRGDGDGMANRRIILSLSDLSDREPIGLPPPQALDIGDTVVLVDEESLRVRVVEVTVRLGDRP